MRKASNANPFSQKRPIGRLLCVAFAALLFVCGFSSATGEGGVAQALPETNDALALVALPSATLASEYRQGLRDVYAAYPDAATVVIEKATDEQQSALTAELLALGAKVASVFCARPVSKRVYDSKTAQLSRWNRDKTTAALVAEIRRLRPAVVVSPSVGANAASESALQTLLADARANAADARYEHTQAAETCLWYAAEQATFPAAGGYPACTREQAVQASRDGMRASLAQSWSGVAPDPAALGVALPDGFLSEGENVYQNADAGLWYYQSASLCVVVRRYQSSSDVWLEADVRVNPDTDERLRQLTIVEGKLAGRNVWPEEIAKASRAVLAINGDYHAFRADSRMKVGNIVRAGQVLYRADDGKDRRSFPPLDDLALLSDGGMRVFAYGEKTPEDYLAMGAYDVYRFGPMLARSGELLSVSGKVWRASEPRCALGMLERYHYLAVMVEGRLSSADGCGLQELAELMWLRGATEALNLDGGHTATMYFMGKRISVVGSYGGGTSAPRKMNELIGVGMSALVGDQVSNGQ